MMKSKSSEMPKRILYLFMAGALLTVLTLFRSESRGESMPSADECLRRRLVGLSDNFLNFTKKDNQGDRPDAIGSQPSGLQCLLGKMPMQKNEKGVDTKIPYASSRPLGVGKSFFYWGLNTVSAGWTNEKGQWKMGQIVSLFGVLTTCSLVSMGAGYCTTVGGAIPLFVFLTYFTFGVARNTLQQEGKFDKKSLGWGLAGFVPSAMGLATFVDLASNATMSHGIIYMWAAFALIYLVMGSILAANSSSFNGKAQWLLIAGGIGLGLGVPALLVAQTIPAAADNAINQVDPNAVLYCGIVLASLGGLCVFGSLISRYCCK